MVGASTETRDRPEKEDRSLWPYSLHDLREHYQGVESILSQMQREFLRGEKLFTFTGRNPTSKSRYIRAAQYYQAYSVTRRFQPRLEYGIWGDGLNMVLAGWDFSELEERTLAWLFDSPQEGYITYIQDEPTCRSCVQRLGGYRSEVYHTAYKSSHGNIHLCANEYSTSTIERWIEQYNRLSVRLYYSGGCIVGHTGRPVFAHWKPAWYVKWIRQARKHPEIIEESTAPCGPMARPGQCGECWYREIDERHDAVWARIRKVIQSQRPEVIKRQRYSEDTNE